MFKRSLALWPWRLPRLRSEPVAQVLPREEEWNQEAEKLKNSQSEPLECPREKLARLAPFGSEIKKLYL